VFHQLVDVCVRQRALSESERAVHPHLVRAREEHEGHGQRTRRFGRRGDPLDGMGKVVDRPRRIARRVFDRRADEIRLSAGEADRGGRRLRGVAVSVLQIGGDRKIRRVGDCCRIGE
jgi:hypothetical protein